MMNWALAKEKVGAICVDFLPLGATKLKIYFLERHVEIREIRKKTKLLKPSRKRELLDKFVRRLDKEKKKFFYVTKKLDESGNLSSIKLYKIFEVNRISDGFRKAWSEINSFLKVAGKNKLIKQKNFFEKICLENGMNLYPVIIAVDISEKGENIDLYFSFN